MFSKNFFILIFIIYITQISCQLTPNISICYPVPLALNEQLALYQLQLGCQSLYPYSQLAEFSCCEIEFQEKENSSAPRRHGCMAFLKSYIDNDRYEDIIDWIERGKEDNFETYSVFLGKTAYDMFQGFIKNETKHDVYKLDCFSKFISNKYLFSFILLFAII